MHVLNIPNILTLIRMALIPVIVISFYLPYAWAHYLCAVIFLFASLTDWLDGTLARHLNEVTKFGAFIDPVVDKLMVAVALIMLVERLNTLWISIPAIIIISREIIISALREWMAEIGERHHVVVTSVGKLKTSMQMGAIFILFLSIGEGSYWLRLLGFLTLYVACGLTIWSMYLYLCSSWHTLQRSMRI